MKRNNVISIDEYRHRKLKSSATFQQAIEIHLEEAINFRKTAEDIRQCLDGNIKYCLEEEKTVTPQSER